MQNKDTLTKYGSLRDETIASLIKEKKYTLFHSVLGRGYQRLDQGITFEEYSGRYGTGYKKHIPNAYDHNTGNRFHRIEYWLATINPKYANNYAIKR